MLLGRADDPPRYDPGAGTVTNASYRVDLVENQPTIVTLPAGRYWIVNSNGVWITAQACTRRLSDIRRL
jgi:hypothetical protein